MFLIWYNTILDRALSSVSGGSANSGWLSHNPCYSGYKSSLILAIFEQVRNRDEQTRAVASAEVRALQARMNSHFLFNALNALAGLATVAPREVPRATGRLRQFLRASFDQQEQALVPLEEELTVVRVYLEIEPLRFGDRLKVEQTIDPGLLKVLVRSRYHIMRTANPPGTS